MYLYSVTAVADGRPLACWLIASDPDEATAKASEHLPTGGKIAHCIGFGKATLGNLEHSKLLQFVPQGDAINFTSRAILDCIQMQALLNRQLQETIDLLATIIKKRIPLPTEENEDDQLPSPDDSHD